jgi:hypothetical protein
MIYVHFCGSWGHYTCLSWLPTFFRFGTCIFFRSSILKFINLRLTVTILFCWLAHNELGTPISWATQLLVLLWRLKCFHYYYCWKCLGVRWQSSHFIWKISLHVHTYYYTSSFQFFETRLTSIKIGGPTKIWNDNFCTWIPKLLLKLTFYFVGVLKWRLDILIFQCACRIV